jgi:hypothetical protein
MTRRNRRVIRKLTTYDPRINHRSINTVRMTLSILRRLSAGLKVQEEEDLQVKDSLMVREEEIKPILMRRLPTRKERAILAIIWSQLSDRKVH